MPTTEILGEFKKNLIIFFDELIDQFPNEGDLVLLRLFLSTQIPIEEVMKTFTYSINKNEQELRKMVKERNDTFFLEHNVFENVNKNKVSRFKKLWVSESLDVDDKNVIWNWVDVFIYLSDKYMSSI